MFSFELNIGKFKTFFVAKSYCVVDATHPSYINVSYVHL